MAEGYKILQVYFLSTNMAATLTILKLTSFFKALQLPFPSIYDPLFCHSFILYIRISMQWKDAFRTSFISYVIN